MSSPDPIAEVADWFDENSAKEVNKIQRLYPRDEVMRFLTWTALRQPPEKRKSIRILELGCGSCANLWAIAKEGFDAYGIDLSQTAIDLGKQTLAKWNVTADLATGSMTQLPYSAEHFDYIIDIFSSYCLPFSPFQACLEEVYRTLKPGGLFFSYTPSANSDAFKTFAPAQKLDDYTLNGIYRESSPFHGNFYPFRFMDDKICRKVFEDHHLSVLYLEHVGLTYSKQAEYFEFLSVVGKKLSHRVLAGTLPQA